jgi:adenylate cyclase
MFGTTKSPQESLEKAIELTQKAIAQDDGDPYGHATLGWVYCLKREYDKAIAEGKRAVALNPSGAIVHVRYGDSLINAGQSEEAIPVLRKAIRLNPFCPSSYYLAFGGALFNTDRFEEAVSAYQKAVQRAPDNIFAHLGLAGTYSMMGREKEARAEAGEVLRINPKFSLDYFAKILPYKDQSQIDKAVNALRKAGLK